jgi:hypothetical protein
MFRFHSVRYCTMLEVKILLPLSQAPTTYHHNAFTFILSLSRRQAGIAREPLNDIFLYVQKRVSHAPPTPSARNGPVYAGISYRNFFLSLNLLLAILLSKNAYRYGMFLNYALAN